MNTTVSWLLELSVTPENQSAFRELMSEMVESTHAESGTLIYEWFVDGDAVHLYERYANSAAALEHLGTFGQQFMERFLALATPTRFSVYGEPDEAVRGVVAGFGAVHYGTLGGFSR